MPQLIAARYELLEVLGRGGMGAVWRARDRTLGREVAIKEVSLPQGLDAAQVERTYARTFREARSAARLDHPGIVTVHDVVEEDGRPWIVMQLVRAEGLDKVIAREGPLPPGRVASIGLDLLDALRAAHTAGVVHRDVKPGNVLLPPATAIPGGVGGGPPTAERAVLTDFGIATVAGDETLTQAGAIVGSPAYLAPEQARHQKATPASDLWSLGATLYAAVEGRPPYNRPDVWGVMAAVLSDEPDPVQSAGPLAPVLHGPLRKDPGQRIHPDEAARQLRQVAQGAAPFPPPVPVSQGGGPPHNVTLQPGAATTAGARPSSTMPPPAPVRRPPWPLIIPAGVFAVALIAAVVVIVWFTREGGGDQNRATPPASSSATGSSVPAGYVPYRGSAFVAAVPKGWKSDGTGDDVTFTDQTPGVKRGMAIQRVASFGDPGDGLADAVQKMKNSSDYQDFKQESFDRNVSYKGQKAAEVQFSFTQNGQPARARVRVFKFDGALYQVLLASYQSQWDQGVPYYRTFLDTLQSTS